MTTENTTSNQTAKINMPTPGMTELACPFCGNYDLEAGYWYIDDEEVDAWECNNCKAGAPQRVWNQRAPTPVQENHQHLLIEASPELRELVEKDDQPGRVREG